MSVDLKLQFVREEPGRYAVFVEDFLAPVVVRRTLAGGRRGDGTVWVVDWRPSARIGIIRVWQRIIPDYDVVIGRLADAHETLIEAKAALVQALAEIPDESKEALRAAGEGVAGGEADAPRVGGDASATAGACGGGCG